MLNHKGLAKDHLSQVAKLKNRD